MYEAKIIGTGSYAPEHIVTNDDLSKIVDTSDEWISSRTGIKERRISTGEGTVDISTKASIMAIKSSGITAEDLDMIIVATTSPDKLFPSTACEVQANIGAGNAFAYDIYAACTGFIYGINTAFQYIRTGQCKNVLVIGAEVLSKFIDWTDRDTCVLFGDAAGAVIISRSEEKGIYTVFSASDGKLGNVLSCTALSVNNPFASLVDTTLSDTIYGKLKMNGREVFKFATRVMLESIDKVLADSGMTIEEIKYIVPHQANQRIIDATAKKYKLDMNKFYTNLEKFGNTSSASIPNALDEMVKKNLLKKGDRIILVSFGAGLTWGASLLEW